MLFGASTSGPAVTIQRFTPQEYVAACGTIELTCANLSVISVERSGIYELKNTCGGNHDSITIPYKGNELSDTSTAENIYAYLLTKDGYYRAQNTKTDPANSGIAWLYSDDAYHLALKDSSHMKFTVSDSASAS